MPPHPRPFHACLTELVAVLPPLTKVHPKLSRRWARSLQLADRTGKPLLHPRPDSGSQPVMAMPVAGVLRSIMLNHWYHHRGQLSVYLRFLGVPLPSIYGPTADENPFA